ncbi:hypothetical protein IP92_01383 [Pseudoduganella flava]|uniref:DUF1349 domain-containing protein n=1 Tax=Pseudoduganella flava TaxID=871742 RepID=A0A562Q0H6_9BURK|nr:DUF1349 domain-containing protein [Pseudoduganella flava]QGZ38309.1 DUF1349 domain-containing protein [Pseudoduganella flava]TWI50154.1 hypothetical protein IP92_01383 [Pseudoduganella flava]
MFSSSTWLNEPASWSIDAHTLRVVTDTKTDFWRGTYYDFVRDSGHFLGRAIDGPFTAQLRVDARFTELYDQAGLMVRIDERRWLKAGVEFSDGQPMLSSVLTNELSDWATMPAPALADCFWLRATVERGAIRVQYSVDGITWPLLRLGPFPAADSYLVGPMCCTPERTGLEVSFTDFTVGPPLGKDLHDLT